MDANVFFSDLFGFITDPFTSFVVVAATAVAVWLTVRKAGFSVVVAIVAELPFLAALVTIVVYPFVLHSQAHGGGFGFSPERYWGFWWVFDASNYYVTGIQRAHDMSVLYAVDGASLVVGWVVMMLVSFSIWPVNRQVNELNHLLSSRAFGAAAADVAEEVKPATRRRTGATPGPLPERAPAPGVAEMATCANCGASYPAAQSVFHECPAGTTGAG